MHLYCTAQHDSSRSPALCRNWLQTQLPQLILQSRGETCECYFLRTCSQSDFSSYGVNNHEYTEAAENPPPPLGCLSKLVPPSKVSWPLPGLIARWSQFQHCLSSLSEHTYWGIRGVMGGWSLKILAQCSLPVSISVPENAMGPCLVRLWCYGAWWAGLPQWRHLRGPGQLQPIMVERTSAWGTGSLPCQLRHTGALVRAEYAPEGHTGAALLTWQGQRGSASSLGPRTYGGFGFVLIYWQLIFWNVGMKGNPLKRIQIFPPIFHISEGEGAKILDCSLRPCWILPTATLLWLSTDNFLQLGLSCGNAPQASQASVFR